MADTALVITGPTAVGKTVVAIQVAKRIDGEIISMDSRQVYRGMDIGTAKPTVEARAGIAHYGFDLVAPDERYSAGRFARDARFWISHVWARGRVPILVGGTGFFLRALTSPLFREPDVPVQHRRALAHALSEWPTGELRRWAEKLDPAAGVMLAGGRQRLARIVEVALLTGRRLSWWHGNAPATEEPLAAFVVVLELPRDELFRRIDERVRQMVSDGLVDEVRELLAQGYSASDPGMSATGYSELIPFVQGTRTLSEAISLIQTATRQYARRQLTWFRHQLPPDAVRLDAGHPTEALAATIEELWKERAP